MLGGHGPLGNMAFLIAPAVMTIIAVCFLAVFYPHWARQAAARAKAKPAALPVLFTLPDFSLTERSGRPVSLAALKGKVWVANFIFTHCTGPCPLMTQQMAGLQAALASQPDVRLVTISVDPARDTPARLTEYAAQFHADPQRWLFLTGDRQAIYDLSAQGFKLGTIVERDEVATTDHPILHSTKFALVDRQGQIRQYYDGTSEEDMLRLTTDARQLAAETK